MHLAPHLQDPLSDDDKDDTDDGGDDALDTHGIAADVDMELKPFRKSTHLPPFADMSSPLTWWAQHCHAYPLLAELARIVLGCPGSQIECERIFSLAWLLTAALRNRMSSERLSSVVIISKSINVDKVLNDLLGNFMNKICLVR